VARRGFCIINYLNTGMLKTYKNINFKKQCILEGLCIDSCLFLVHIPSYRMIDLPDLCQLSDMEEYTPIVHMLLLPIV
jgi:4-amino-4-deoxy-L-arabinose transferase-like glycosyltransferase